MTLSKETCYQAHCARDKAYDGLFFTAVITTGIFCRPVGPSRNPRIENCQFFVDAKTALISGYRPCQRCRPEAAPGSPAWRGVLTTLSRACRLIDAGALDDHGGLAVVSVRLGITLRYLRQLFNKHLGLSPVKYAQVRRLSHAHDLLLASVAPITEIAYATGFNSIRRFNSAFLGHYKISPSALRQHDTSGYSGGQE